MPVVLMFQTHGRLIKHRNDELLGGDDKNARPYGDTRVLRVGKTTKGRDQFHGQVFAQLCKRIRVSVLFLLQFVVNISTHSKQDCRVQTDVLVQGQTYASASNHNQVYYGHLPVSFKLRSMVVRTMMVKAIQKRTKKPLKLEYSEPDAVALTEGGALVGVPGPGVLGALERSQVNCRDGRTAIEVLSYLEGAGEEAVVASSRPESRPSPRSSILPSARLDLA
ncbi:hypothetical protein KCU61_g294, partial [Aureobasidium melanogenum]